MRPVAQPEAASSARHWATIAAPATGGRRRVNQPARRSYSARPANPYEAVATETLARKPSATSTPAKATPKLQTPLAAVWPAATLPEPIKQDSNGTWTCWPARRGTTSTARSTRLLKCGPGFRQRLLLAIVALRNSI